MVRKAVRLVMVKDGQLLVMHRNKFGQEYYSLIGGGVDVGETPEQAIKREVAEEAGLQIDNPRLVYVEEAPKPFGIQYIYLANYPGGEVALNTNSDEAKINALKQNLYTPMWLEISKLPEVPFLSTQLKQHLIQDLAESFPEKVVTFSSEATYENLKKEAN